MRSPEIDARPFHFSATEFTRRPGALESVLAAAGLTCIAVRANRPGSAVPRFTGWPVIREALVLVAAGEQDVLFVNLDIHVPNAGPVCPQTEVRWVGKEPIATIRQVLGGRVAGPVGLLGPLGIEDFRDLARVRCLVDLGTQFLNLRVHKWAALTDLAAIALTEHSSVGSTERELWAKPEQAYVSHGGHHIHHLASAAVASPDRCVPHIHHLASAAVASPDRCVPAHWHTDRIVSDGELLTFELSASSAPDYPGQLLRTFTVGAEPTPLVADLDAVASAAFEVIESRLRLGSRLPSSSMRRRWLSLLDAPRWTIWFTVSAVAVYLRSSARPGARQFQAFRSRPV